VAEDRLSNREIAAEVGVAHETFRRWKLHPEFLARVDSLVSAISETLKARSIASREYRIEVLNDRWDRLKRLMEARAQQMADVPGGDSGLLMKVLRQVKVQISLDDLAPGGTSVSQRAKRTIEKAAGGKRTVEVADYVLDTALLRELRELERHVAMETGQWRRPEPTVNLLVMAGEAPKALPGGPELLALQAGNISMERLLQPPRAEETEAAETE
jgi:hypothetical protein